MNISKSILRIGYESAHRERYTDAQIDDYTMLSKSEYIWKPPLRMTVRARSSHPAGVLNGTAGFGFWNKPFTMSGNWFTLPEAIWFFHSSPPSNMALVPGIPGFGWKAQVIHTTPLSVISQALPVSLGAAYGRLSQSAPSGHALRRFTGAHEALINEDMTQWHTYALEWHARDAIFWVDDKVVLRVPQAPTHPLGFVAWLDNEYAIVTPRGELRFGKTHTGPQWLDLDSIKIEQI